MRLADWTPAYIESATWDQATRCARILMDAGPKGATISWSQRGQATRVVLDDRRVNPERGRERGPWTLWQTRVPAGRHQLLIKLP